MRIAAALAPQLQQRRSQQEQAQQLQQRRGEQGRREHTGTNLPRMQPSSSPSSFSSPQQYSSSVSSGRVNLKPHPATVIKTIASRMPSFSAYMKKQAGLLEKEERERTIPTLQINCFQLMHGGRKQESFRLYSGKLH